MTQKCDLCPQECLIPEGSNGICHVRGNRGGSIKLLNYGVVSTAIIGPIEDKPFYHFHPGSKVLSIGGVGCNMTCGFCQNFKISQTGKSKDSVRLEPNEIIALAKEKNVKSIVFTYSEPVVAYEFVLDIANLAKKASLNFLLKTNGFCNPKYFKILAKNADAINIDIKGGHDSYRDVCGAGNDLEYSKWELAENIRLTREHSRLECSIMFIPKYLKETEDILIALNEDIGSETPIHILGFIPFFKMGDEDPTSKGEINSFKRFCLNYFDNVYLALRWERNDTLCRNCKTKLVTHQGFEVIYKVDSAKCHNCGMESGIIL